MAGVAQPQAPVHARTPEKNQCFSGAQTSLGCRPGNGQASPRSLGVPPLGDHPALRRHSFDFLSPSWEISIVIPQFLQELGEPGFSPLMGFSLPILYDSLRR